MIESVDVVTQRILLGPGPSDVHPRVLAAMARPVVGHLDPIFLSMMDEVQDGLRRVFGTANKLTLPMSGTGSSGMETAFVNLIEPGDRVVVGVNGFFGMRMCDIAGRCGAEVIPVEAPWGQPVDPDDVRKAARGGAEVIAVVHAETSTGALTPLEPLAEIARAVDALLVVDCVTSLGGMAVDVDRVGIDVAYSGTQKCLSTPPSLAPITVSERALDRMRRRQRKVQSWYLDLTMLSQYWAEGAGGRFYHHTAPITAIYALHEALRLIAEEGLEARFRRHATAGAALQAGLQALGLEILASDGFRLPMLTAAVVPDGLDESAIRRQLLNDYGIEIGGGLGPVAGKVWRFGLMGYSAQRRNVVLVLAALEQLLRRAGAKIDPGAGVAAAEAVFVAARL